jgi:hypothetical protein
VGGRESNPSSPSTLPETVTAALILPIILCLGLGHAAPLDDKWDYSDPAATEQIFRGLRPEIEASGDLDTLLQLETQIARTLGLQGKLEAGHAMLDAVDARLSSRTPVASVRSLLSTDPWFAKHKAERLERMARLGGLKAP